jgi:ElaB/YqjD/DUF883 family membrane-anchored ribosome-binding protein
MGETVDAIGYKADVKSRAKDKMTETKDRITGKVSDATPDGRQVKRAASTAQENPLGLAIGGVAVGFLVGLVVPSTRVEDERLGEMSDQVKQAARETGQEAVERGKRVAQEAGQAAMETAREKGKEESGELSSTLRDRSQEVASGQSPQG